MVKIKKEKFNFNIENFSLQKTEKFNIINKNKFVKMGLR